MDKRITRLSELECDIKSAMERLLDDEEFYIECLSLIPDDENFHELGETLNKGDAAGAFNCAHTLKGVLGNLGLSPMYNKAIEIVEPLRKGNCENLIPKYNELCEMKETLRKILEDK